MDDEEMKKIEGLNDTLYSRTRYRSPLDHRTAMKSSESSDVVEKWESPGLDEMLKHERTPQKTSSLMKKIFIGSLLFFIGTLIVAALVFTGGINFVSSKNVDVSALGPTTISAGEILELGVGISNTNNADLEFANLSIKYPQGSRSPDDTAQPLTYSKEVLGVVKAGSESVRNVRMVLLGSTGETKEIKFSVEYKVKGSSATFYKDKIYEVTIGDAPVTLAINSPETVVSGDSFTTTVSVALNSTDVLKNVVLKAEYPYGYDITDSVPKSFSSDNLWSLGDLAPGDKKTITIRGKLVGEDKEERTFRFYVGVSDSSSINPNFQTVIVSSLDTVTVTRPSVGLNITFNQENVSTYIAPTARSINTSTRFQNNLPDKLLNPSLEVTFSGQALDKSSVRVGNNGIYDSGASRATWTLTNSSGLRELVPGENGQVSLSFASLPTVPTTGSGRDINLNFTLTGIPVATVGQNPISISESRTVRISSQINLTSKTLRTLGSFANFGPVPPQVNKETSYTIVFSLGNIQNAIADGRITAKLGTNVNWLGSQVTLNENIIYDSAMKTVTWDIGELKAGTDSTSLPREMSFQISLTPTSSQIGTAPVLVSNIIFTGRDTITGGTITLTSPALTTKLTNDPSFIQGDDIVVK